MNDAKPWWQSSTIITLAIAALLKLLVIAGIPADVAPKYAGDIVTYGLPLIGVALDAFAAWRRVKATAVLTVRKPPPPSEPTETGAT